MNRELFGQFLGIIIIVIAMWFLSLTIVGYVKGDLNPFHWTIAERGIHLAIQAVLVCVYFWVSKARSGA